MLSMKRDKKDEEEVGGGNPFYNLEKSSVLQEGASLFNETPVNARKCTMSLTKILYLLNQGENLSTAEATKAFFALTKLYQSKDPTLRRMMYLGIKELSQKANDVIIVTQSLIKDVMGKEENYKAPALRALVSILDSSMIQAIERYVREAIVSKTSAAFSSAALVSCIHLMKTSPDVVSRWASDAQQVALTSDNHMVQYHCLGLYFMSRKGARQDVTKMVAKLSRQSLKSPYAMCFLIRIVSKLIEDGDEGSNLVDFLESCIRHKSEMVVYEAASAIVNLSSVPTRSLSAAVSVLQLFLSSSKQVLRYAAVRTLNKVSVAHPEAVVACNLDLENLSTDTNRLVATLANTTLLNTCSESSVDRLMRQISTFVSDISDELKISVVQNIRTLCRRFPRKHTLLMTYLSSFLREEGGVDYKSATVDTIIAIIEDNPEAKETGLVHLCDFIEDCEHTGLAVRIIHLLGQEGPRVKEPARYIRYIYNRVLLENVAVRAAAVSTLARFGAVCETLLPNILVLLRRCEMDTDDEVRDRATYYRTLLEQRQATLNNKYILNGLQVSVANLEKALQQYLQLGQFEKPFDMATVPLAPVEEVQKKSASVEPGVLPSAVRAAVPQENHAEKLAKIAQFARYGPLFKTTAPTELSDMDSECGVKVIKHVFTNHIILQFDCVNTMNDQILENARVELDTAEGFVVDAIVPCARLDYNTVGSTYVGLQLPESLLDCIGSCPAKLTFTARDCDPNTGLPDSDAGFENDYPLDEVDILLADHVQRVIQTSFPNAWDELGEGAEIEDAYALSERTLEEAVKKIIAFLGLQPCEGSDRVPEGKTSHMLYLSGKFRGGYDVLVRARMGLTADGVTLQLAARSPEPDVSELITSSIG